MKKLIQVIFLLTVVFLCSTTGYAQNIYKNELFDFSLAIPDKVHSNPLNMFQNDAEGTLKLTSLDDEFSAVINCDKADSSALTAMRKYLNDYSSTDDDIFNKLAEFKDSYFDAMVNSYKKDFLFGIEKGVFDEANIKVFNHYSQEVNGVNAHVVLYNEIKSNIDGSVENTHINISIPMNSNKTFYNVNFLIKKGYLDEEILQIMSDMIKSLNLNSQDDFNVQLDVFKDSKSIKAANLGIYPNLLDINVTYDEFTNQRAGYKLKYPPTYASYLNNSVAGTYDYKSFKINYNHFISITMFPNSTGTDLVEEKLKTLKEIEKQSIHISNEGTRTFGSKEFRFIKYNITDEKGLTTYLQDYYIQEGNRLFQIELNSRFIRPSFIILSEFMNILHSFEIIPHTDAGSMIGESASGFTNINEGYSIFYPARWELTDNISKDPNYDTYMIKNKDYSGPLDIIISEGELKSGLTSDDIKMLSQNSAVTELDKYFKKYSPPYSGKLLKNLSSTYEIKGDAVYFYRLVNYVDSNERVRLCYSIDIVRGNKVVSLFVSTGEYLTTTGRILDSDIQHVIDWISSSFTVVSTPVYSQRVLESETRNNKVVQIENFLKSQLGKQAQVSSIVFGESNNDIVAKVENVAEYGFYRIKADFIGSKFQIVEKMLVNDIFTDAASQIIKDFQDKLIDEIANYEDDMSIDVEYRKDRNSSPVRKTFYIVVQVKNNHLTWSLDIKRQIS
jgi:hypothetical protein